MEYQPGPPKEVRGRASEHTDIWDELEEQGKVFWEGVLN